MRIAQRLQQFQQSIDNLKAVEKMLATMKTDLMATRQQRDALLAEYKNIEQLKSLDEKQIEAIGYALGRRSWRQWIVDLLVGIGIGIAGSLIATLLYNWWQRRKTPA